MPAPRLASQYRDEENGLRGDSSVHGPRPASADSSCATRDCNKNQAIAPPAPSAFHRSKVADDISTIADFREMPSGRLHRRLADAPRRIGFAEKRWISAQPRNPTQPPLLPASQRETPQHSASAPGSNDGRRYECRSPAPDLT